ncbi:Hypothetical predicted protein [Mytilus galloprovincialis]|uniref:Uncharacterized protein n=1 Tax=Mytilus galloprovincialis TaxID=29158 RepID=A0A8B6HME2_MYTGA|nr:Hypothetical predicted protein [Mytilus galloprovincialis]
MKLRPSEIFFSQDSIAKNWGKHTRFNAKFIGDTLDELLTKSISLTDIPKISAVMIDGEFVTCDNRRLWVFRKAEELGFLDYIEFNQVTPRQLNRNNKLTTYNGGKSIRIRSGGDPGGITWRTWKPYTFQEVNKNTVRESPLSAHQSKTNVFQDSLCNKTVTDVKCRSNYLSSYSNNHFSKPNNSFRNGDTKVSDKENHLPFTTKSKQEGSNSNLESTLSKTAVSVQKPHDYTMMTDDISDTNYLNTSTLATRPIMFKSRYRNYNSSRPRFRPVKIVSNNLDTHIPDQNIELSRMGPIFEEEATPCRESYFESNLIKTGFLVKGAHANHANTNRIGINQDTLCSRPVSDFNLPNIFKSPHGKNNPTRPSFATDKTFKNNVESQVVNTGIQLSPAKSTSQEESTIHKKSPFESISGKTLLPVHRPQPDTGRTDVIKDSSCNKTFIENELQSKDKSSCRKFDFARPDFICGNALTNILESEVPDHQIKRPTINTKSQGEVKTKSKYEEETAICNKPFVVSTLSKTLLPVNRPHPDTGRTDVITDSPCNETFTKAYLSKTKPLYRKNLLERPGVISDNRIEAKPRSPYSFGANLDQTSLAVKKPHPYTSGTENGNDSACNQTIIKAKRKSKDILAYIKPFSARPNDI